MYFAKIQTKFLHKGTVQPYITQRFEYLLHYWTFLFSPYPFDTTIAKFESHRSVFKKIFAQLTYNREKSKNILQNVLLVDNPLFQDDNLFIRKIRSRNFRKLLTDLKSQVGTMDKANLATVEKNFIAMRRHILKNYTLRLSRYLYKTVRKNTPLQAQDAADLKFLANAFIAELLEYGYDKQFIDFVINAVTLTAHPLDQSFNIPFDKSELDFPPDGNEFREYVSEQRKQMSLLKLTESLKNLLTAKKHTVTAVFRVNNLKLRLSHAVSMWDVKLLKPETLLPSNDRKVDVFLKSADCILVTSFDSPDFSSIPSVHISNAHRAIQGINALHGTCGKVDDSTIVLTTANRDRFKIVNRTSNFNKEINSRNYNQKVIDKYNKLTSKHELHEELRNLIALGGKLSTSLESTSIKDFWSSVESLFDYKQSVTAKKDELTTLVQNCYKIHFKRGFEKTNTHFMNIAFKVGLLPTYAYSERHSSHFYNEFQNRISNPQLLYQREIMPWIRYTINHIYGDRNLEVHNTIRNELSYQSVFKNFTRMIFLAIHIVLKQIGSEHSMQRISERIRLKALTVGL